MKLLEKNLDLSIIIPAYNEYDSLKQNLNSWIEFTLANGFELIIVNDGSTDQSKILLDSLQEYGHVKIIHHKVNAGYGGALKKGINNSEREFVITIDADGQHSVETIHVLANELVKTDADMVIGKRYDDNKRVSLRNVGKFLIRLISRILIPNSISDLNSGMKLYRTSLVKKYLSLCPNSMAFSDVITLSFLSNRHLIVEVPIEVHPRKTGKSTININTAIQTIIEIFNIVMLFNPLKIFLPLFIIFLLAGLIWGIPIAIAGRGVSVGATLAILSSGLCLLLGLLAEQLSKIRLEILENKNNKE